MNNIKDIRIMNGTWGQLWLDSDLVGECYGLQAKSAFNKDEIALCGVMAVGTKIKSIKNTGSVKLYKVNSRMAQKIGDEVKAGRDPRLVLISKLADPDALGAERVALKDVSFDDLTLADWEAATTGKVEAPFTFGSYEFLDMVGV